MTTITGYTADRMQQIEDGTVVDGEVVGDNLILTTHAGTEINAGNVRGPQGIAGPTAGPPTRQVFTTVGAGTYNRPADCVAILVECVGGGGGGGGSGAGGNGTGCIGVAQGGAAGQYAAKLIANPASTYAYSVGGGGAHGVATPTNGSPGGDTTFGTTQVRAKGGAGGNAGGATYISSQNGGTTGVGGAAGSEANGIGDVVVAGGSGGNGVAMTGGNGSTTRFAHGACGGASVFGSGGYGGVGTGAATPGSAGIPRGSGGGGGALIDGGWGDGGSGAPGIIIITEFY